MIAVTVGAALGIPVVGICSLDAIARGVRSAARGSAGEPVFGVATDARRKEVYWALYDVHGSRVAGPAVNKPAQLLADVGCRSWAGNGFDRYRLLADQNGVQLLQPSTPSAAVLGGMVIEGLVRGEQPRAMLPNVGAHSGDGAGSIAKGDRLLAPYPLYLRRPDAVEPATGVGVVHA
jgi:tRNA A37 threonylcarbamoyladenosine modification protein TsaB